jgi:hypothetical protein
LTSNSVKTRILQAKRNISFGKTTELKLPEENSVVSANIIAVVCMRAPNPSETFWKFPAGEKIYLN